MEEGGSVAQMLTLMCWLTVVRCGFSGLLNGADGMKQRLAATEVLMCRSSLIFACIQELSKSLRKLVPECAYYATELCCLLLGILRGTDEAINSCRGGGKGAESGELFREGETWGVNWSRAGTVLMALVTTLISHITRCLEGCWIGLLQKILDDLCIAQVTPSDGILAFPPFVGPTENISADSGFLPKCTTTATVDVQHRLFDSSFNSCTQAACQSAEYLVDLLHDEVQVVREAAAQGLLQLARHARPTFLAAKQPRGSGAGVPDATPSLHNISGMDGKAAARLAVGVHGSSAGAGAEVQEQPQAHDAAGVSLLGRQTQAECLQNVAEAGAEAQEQPQAHDTADYADLFGGHVRTEVRPCDETTSGQATAPAPGADAVAAAGPLLAVLLDRDQTRSLISSLSDPSPLVSGLTRTSSLPFQAPIGAPVILSPRSLIESLVNF
eukprot:1137374-Pelagomonas_calceolata.AAC.2